MVVRPPPLRRRPLDAFHCGMIFHIVSLFVVVSLVVSHSWISGVFAHTSRHGPATITMMISHPQRHRHSVSQKKDEFITTAITTFRRRRKSQVGQNQPSVQLVSTSSFSQRNHHAPSTSPATMELTVLGTVLASTVEIATATLMNYITGYVTGYVIGTIIGIPQSLLQQHRGAAGGSSSSSTNVVPSFIPQQWWQSIHKKAHVQYGRKWGNVSSIFGGCRTLVTVVRRQRPPPSLQHKTKRNEMELRTTTWIQQQQEHDKWNDIMSSLLAGALLARSGNDWVASSGRWTTRHDSKCYFIWWHVLFIFIQYIVVTNQS